MLRSSRLMVNPPAPPPPAPGSQPSHPGPRPLQTAPAAPPSTCWPAAGCGCSPLSESPRSETAAASTGPQPRPMDACKCAIASGSRWKSGQANPRTTFHLPPLPQRPAGAPAGAAPSCSQVAYYTFNSSHQLDTFSILLLQRQHSCRRSSHAADPAAGGERRKRNRLPVLPRATRRPWLR